MELRESTSVKEIIENIEIDLNQTPEKYQTESTEVLEFLVTNLLKLDNLEKEIYQRSNELKNPEQPNQVQDGEEELWKEFALRRKEIINPICLNPSDTSSNSFGEPSSFNYLYYTDTKILFIMKSAKRAVIEFYYEYGLKEKNQFVLKKMENKWKIDSKKYGFQSNNKWFKDYL